MKIMQITNVLNQPKQVSSSPIQNTKSSPINNNDSFIKTTSLDKIAFKGASAEKLKLIQAGTELLEKGLESFASELKIEPTAIGKKFAKSVEKTLPDNLVGKFNALIESYNNLTKTPSAAQIPLSVNPHFERNIYQAAIESHNHHMEVLDKAIDLTFDMKEHPHKIDSNSILYTVPQLIRKNAAEGTLTKNKLVLIDSIEHYNQDKGTINLAIEFCQTNTEIMKRQIKASLSKLFTE